ncbi:MAG: protein translocase subunit SecF [Candidatus Aenigmarchaeota archaeon]|nr:protein translocase subunit SecF [Candidatus Aenigmarchaeota archaeon]
MVSYKALMVIPLALLIGSIAILVAGYAQTGEWFQRSIDLKGGTLITLPEADLAAVEAALPDARVRSIGGFGGQAVLAELEGDPAAALAALKAAGIETGDASVQTIGSSLGENFWVQAQIGIVAAFVLMGIVVFFLFRKVVPAIAVLFAAITDIVVTLAMMQVFSIQLSLAGLGAILMIIGYSVDTDILTASRVLKEEEGQTKEKIWGAVKTGLTMTLTTIGALAAVIIAGVSAVITQIATILLIGLLVDLITTWLMNAGMIRWYEERRGH